MGGTGLRCTARRNSWGPNYVRFGLSLQDDFEGNSSYNAAARFVLSEFTQTGRRVGVGSAGGRDLAYRHGALSAAARSSSPYFVMPHAQFGARNVDVLDDQRRVAEYRVRSFDYGLDFGREFGNWGEVRAGILRDARQLARARRRPDAAYRGFRRADALRAARLRRARRRELPASRHACLARMAQRVAGSPRR